MQLKLSMPLFLAPTLFHLHTLISMFSLASIHPRYISNLLVPPFQQCTVAVEQIGLMFLVADSALVG